MVCGVLHSSVFLLGLVVLFTQTNARCSTGAGGAIFEIQNNCLFTVWAAGSPRGGQRLDKGQTWVLEGASDTASSRFCGRTECSFNSNGRGSCNTGDCGRLLSCQGHGAPPATIVEYSLNQINNLDLYDISLVDGFNLPMSITPSKSSCHAVACSSNISAICPAELRVSGGCDSACTRFNTLQYCCSGEYSNNCSASNYSSFFKRQCPQAYTCARDDATSTFSCSGSNEFTVVFCSGKATSVQGLNTTMVTPNMTMTPYGSPTMPPRSTNLPHPLTPGNSTHPSGKKSSKKMVILLGGVVGSTVLFVMLCFAFGRCVRLWKTSVRTDAKGKFWGSLF